MPYHRHVLIVVKITKPLPPHTLSRDRWNRAVRIPVPREDELYCAVFTMPEDGKALKYRNPLQHAMLGPPADYDDIQISCPNLPSPFDPSIRTRGFQARDPPVCVYYRNRATNDTMELRIRSCHPNPAHPLRNMYFETSAVRCIWHRPQGEEDDDVRAYVLPGHARPLIWTTWDDVRTPSSPLLDFYSHIHNITGTPGEWSPETDAFNRRRNERQPMPIVIAQKPSRTVHATHIQLPTDVSKLLSYGVKSITWDDWTGR